MRKNAVFGGNEIDSYTRRQTRFELEFTGK